MSDTEHKENKYDHYVSKYAFREIPPDIASVNKAVIWLAPWAFGALAYVKSTPAYIVILALLLAVLVSENAKREKTPP